MNPVNTVITWLEYLILKANKAAAACYWI